MAVVMGGFHTVYRAPNFNGTRTAKVTVFYTVLFRQIGLWTVYTAI